MNHADIAIEAVFNTHTTAQERGRNALISLAWTAIFSYTALHDKGSAGDYLATSTALTSVVLGGYWFMEKHRLNQLTHRAVEAMIYGE